MMLYTQCGTIKIPPCAKVSIDFTDMLMTYPRAGHLITDIQTISYNEYTSYCTAKPLTLTQPLCFDVGATTSKHKSGVRVRGVSD